MIGTEFKAPKTGPPVRDNRRLDAKASPIAMPIATDTRNDVTTAVTVATALVHILPC